MELSACHVLAQDLSSLGKALHGPSHSPPSLPARTLILNVDFKFHSLPRFGEESVPR